MQKTLTKNEAQELKSLLAEIAKEIDAKTSSYEQRLAKLESKILRA